MSVAELAQLATPVALIVAYAMLGWVAEVIFAAVTLGVVTNRGFLAGPYCPIYGFGAVGMVLLLEPVAGNPLLVFLGAAVVASVLELVTGWALEKIFHQRWWDYSERPLNIGGYICASFSVMWGLAGLLLMDVLQPLMSDFLGWLNPWILVIGLAVMLVVMGVDVAATVVSALKLDRQLRAIKDASELLRASTDKISTRIGEGAIEAKDHSQADLERLHQRVDEQRRRLDERAAAAREHLSLTTRRQLKAFPGLRSLRYPEQLEALRAREERRRASRGARNERAEIPGTGAGIHR